MRRISAVHQFGMERQRIANIGHLEN